MKQKFKEICLIILNNFPNNLIPSESQFGKKLFSICKVKSEQDEFNKLKHNIQNDISSYNVILSGHKKVEDAYNLIKSFMDYNIKNNYISNIKYPFFIFMENENFNKKKLNDYYFGQEKKRIDKEEDNEKVSKIILFCYISNNLKGNLMQILNYYHRTNIQIKSMTSEKDIKLKKEEEKKLEYKSEILLKNKNSDININNKYHKFKTKLLCSYIFSFIKIIYIFLFNSKEDKRILIKGYEQQIKANTNKKEFLDYKNILRKDINNKGKNANIKKIIKYNNNKNSIIQKSHHHLIIIMIFFISLVPNNNMIQYKFSNITLKIQGPGFSDVLDPEFINRYYPPHIIFINGNKNTTITSRYYFDKINNTVKLVWNNSIVNTAIMFRFCSNITEIDLSSFDASKVIYMNGMFGYCSKLFSINFANFDTSNVSLWVGCLTVVPNYLH